MEEVVGRDGTWMFDLETLRIVPAADRGVHEVRRALGEVVVPLAAIAGLTYEPGRKAGRLRLRLRAGADPFTQVTGGGIGEAADPYQLSVDNAWSGTAGYLVETVRNALLVREVPAEPTDRYLVEGPAVPQIAEAGDGKAMFDGTLVQLSWNWLAEESKSAAGPQRLALSDLTGVDWQRQSKLGYGYLRFWVKGHQPGVPEHDPHTLAWGIKKEGGTTAVLGAAVAARLPHPLVAAPAPVGDDPDALLRRLKELGELHRAGVLTDEEFTAAKRVLLGQ